MGIGFLQCSETVDQITGQGICSRLVKQNQTSPLFSVCYFLFWWFWGSLHFSSVWIGFFNEFIYLRERRMWDDLEDGEEYAQNMLYEKNFNLNVLKSHIRWLPKNTYCCCRRPEFWSHSWQPLVAPALRDLCLCSNLCRHNTHSHKPTHPTHRERQK